MYRGLWKFITKYMDDSRAVPVFLPLVIIGWTLTGIAVGLVICMFMHTDIINALADLICAGGYAGLFFGLFGGCLFLFRTTE